MTRTILIILTVLAITLGLSGAARAESQCPSGGTPPSGSTVNGGLDVDGTCIIDHVTVNGGITVEAGGHLQLTSSTVNGGIVVLTCGELDVNALTNGSGAPTGTTATINGGVDITAGIVCNPGAFSNADIWTAKIEGGISITGTYANALPQICHNTITGDLHMDNLTAPRGSDVGDPDGAFGCPGNTISGSVHVSNSMFGSVEANTIGGSVLLSGSTLEFNGNTINGSLRCSNGTVIVPGEPGDPTGNTVHGHNTCP